MMKRIELSDGHEIVIGRGLLSRCGDIITRFEKGTRCCVVSDDNVAPIYSERVLDSLNSAGYQASLFVFEHGEKNKHIGTVTQMLNFFAERRLTRHDFVVALGGGLQDRTPQECLRRRTLSARCRRCSAARRPARADRFLGGRKDGLRPARREEPRRGLPSASACNN